MLIRRLALLVVLLFLWPRLVSATCTFVAAGAWGDAGAGQAVNYNVPAPAGIATNDIIIIEAINDINGYTITGTTGTWTSILNNNTGNTGANMTLLWHLATSSGDGPWTVQSSTTDFQAGFATAWRGCNTTSPIDSSAKATVHGASIQSPVVTPVASGGTLVGFWGCNSGGSPTLSGSLTSAFSSVDPNVAFSGIAGYIAAPNGGVASAQYTSTCSTTAWQSVGVVVLAPAAATNTITGYFVPGN